MDGGLPGGTTLASGLAAVAAATNIGGKKAAGGPYKLVRSANVGMTAIMLFARRPQAVHSVQVAECGFGVADMGNKGAVALRVTYDHGDGTDTPAASELTFVAAHLAAMEWNLDRRNANWRAIASGLTFENPKTVADGLDGLGRGLEGREVDSAASAARTPEEAEREDRWLQAGRRLAKHHDALRDVSLFRPASLLFVAGDLNYRIGSRSPPPLAPFPSDRDGHPDHWTKFIERDQLTRERLARRAFAGLVEADIRFPPTYKYDVLPPDDPRGHGGHSPVPWRFAPHRWPSWCDRVLYLDVPTWARTSTSTSTAAGKDGDGKNVAVAVHAYNSLPLMRSSDHQAVFFRAAVPLLTADELAPPPSYSAAGDDDPRLQLPVPIDVDAWQRRAAARRREAMIGWSMLLWSTREGAVLLGTLLVLGATTWWLYQARFLA